MKIGWKKSFKISERVCQNHEEICAEIYLAGPGEIPRSALEELLRLIAGGI